MGRVWFALTEGWRQRAVLKRFLTDPTKQIASLEQITLQKLDQADIAILVLDFDGVLASHDTPVPAPEVVQWLTKIAAEIGEHRIAILTNKPQPARLTFFAQQFPSIFVVQNVKKKPYPDGLWEIANYKGVAPHRLVLVDDRLLTGMLATCLAYSQGWYFTPPRCNYGRHPFKEAFFSTLRVFERVFLRWVG